MTTSTPPRRRAPGMSAEQRREMIVRAALPLVAEYGAVVTTAKIARAAGIGEATIFRVFTDKDELLDACVAEAFRPDHVLTELGSIPLEAPLATRLVEAVTALRAHLDRMGTVLGVLHTSGYRGRTAPGGERKPDGAEGGACGGHDGERSDAEIRDAVADLLEPDRASLRLEPEQLADVFLGLVFSCSHSPYSRLGLTDADGALPVHDFVDLFLNGARTPTPEETA